ncbi:DNA mismatch repair endonuclease MutL [Eubacterium oxidoreducens]|uniref:DNA mismatch repair protein MutL n=1 Tax=Eubacterium oxidoreducens TaxID=1732 RepID=A0A1G6ALC6_EUBOX|nr:DNA mismatch repair endonuclease MutL [Eubacterium oxidoreducens]SDB09187.1 DNA mismatch repair protein MutL [Eubacterium oxidoreducens]
MPEIEVLDKQTIDKIAAGEVIERPSSVVKELVENSIDAGASMVTVEIKDGGISLIRITDNGCGIDKEQVKIAFLRHSTSKIRSVDDLNSISSLGFRGEALSSIAAVSQVELITKTPRAFSGIRFFIEDGIAGELEEIGAPDGTTFLIRNLFYHTPARKKFLKSAQTEAGYINTLMQHLALSHPDISFQLIINNQPKLRTSGNGSLKDVIYQIYGRDVVKELIEVSFENEIFQMKGFIGKPVVSRGNRNFEHFFVNARYIKSQLLSKCVEDAYKLHLMQHQYPFCVLHLTFQGEMLDVNVHPTKMELRFEQPQLVYDAIVPAIKESLEEQELIIESTPLHPKKDITKPQRRPEPFEEERLKKIRESIREDTPYEPKYPEHSPQRVSFVKEKEPVIFTNTVKSTPSTCETEEKFIQKKIEDYVPQIEDWKEFKQREVKIIGQVFDTYWLLEYEKKLYIMDQHAAHEKVMFETFMKQYRTKDFTTQMISPPVVLNLSMTEADNLKKHMDSFTSLGYEIEPFGEDSYCIRGVPANLYGIDLKALFINLLDELSELGKNSTSDLITEKIASMSCKAAIKGNQKISFEEAKALLNQILELDNPYQCPHGRPTLVTISQYEMDKKFKRIV